MSKIIKKISIAVALLSFVAVVWANRSGKFSVKPFDYGGELIPVSESTAVPPEVIPVQVGMFIENVYDLNLATQSIAAEVVAWVSWPQAFQKLLEEEYRRASRVSTPGEKSAREKMKLSFDAANFARKAELIEGFIERIPGRTRQSSSGTGKPAQLYRRGRAEKLDPPLIIPRRATKPAKRTAK